MKRAFSASLLLMLMASQQISVNAEESLRSVEPTKFCFENMLVVDSTVDPENAYINLFSPRSAQVETIWCDKHVKGDTQKWIQDLQVTRSKKIIYGANIKFDKKYAGYRKSVLGRVIETGLMIKDKYKGNPLVDKFKKYH